MLISRERKVAAQRIHPFGYEPIAKHVAVKVTPTSKTVIKSPQTFVAGKRILQPLLHRREIWSADLVILQRPQFSLHLAEMPFNRLQAFADHRRLSEFLSAFVLCPI